MFIQFSITALQIEMQYHFLLYNSQSNFTLYIKLFAEFFFECPLVPNIGDHPWYDDFIPFTLNNSVIVFDNPAFNFLSYDIPLLPGLFLHKLSHEDRTLKGDIFCRSSQYILMVFILIFEPFFIFSITACWSLFPYMRFSTSSYKVTFQTPRFFFVLPSLMFMIPFHRKVSRKYVIGGV